MFFRFQTSVSVYNFNIQLKGSLHNRFSVLGSHIVSNFCSISTTWQEKSRSTTLEFGGNGDVLAVVHKQEFKFFNIFHCELVEPIWQQVFGLLVGSITNLWHSTSSLESSANSVINSSWFSPRFLQKIEKLKSSRKIKIDEWKCKRNCLFFKP